MKYFACRFYITEQVKPTKAFLICQTEQKVNWAKLYTKIEDIFNQFSYLHSKLLSELTNT